MIYETMNVTDIGAKGGIIQFGFLKLKKNSKIDIGDVINH